MLRVCTFCRGNLELVHENFAWRNKARGLFQSQCRSCQKSWRKDHYQKNRQAYIDKASVWRDEQKKTFYDWLKTQVCVDCGQDDFRLLQCDHLLDKSFNVGEKIGVLKFETLMLEVNKCDIVCSNCHIIRTSERGNYYARI